MPAENIFQQFPVIYLSSFVLRQPTYDDIDDYYSYLNNQEVNRFIPRECIPQTIEQTRKEIDYLRDLFSYKRSIYWAIAERDTDRLIGSCGFNYWNRDHKRADISYDLHKDYWNQGVMSQVMKSILTFGFTHMGLHRIEATVTPANEASLALLKKYKFKEEGVLREQKLLHGKFHDAMIMSLLSREFLGF